MKIKGFINKLLKLKLDDLFLFSDCFALGITRHLCPRTFVRPSVSFRDIAELQFLIILKTWQNIIMSRKHSKEMGKL